MKNSILTVIFVYMSNCIPLTSPLNESPPHTPLLCLQVSKRAPLSTSLAFIFYGESSLHKIRYLPFH